jgi:6-phosphogluconolactonase
MSDPNIIVVASPEEASQRAAEVIADALGDAVERRGRADWATTGGSTPSGVYRALMALGRDDVPWESVHTWWGDERFVPADHPLSNAGPFEDIIEEAGAWDLAHQDDRRTHLWVPAENVHPFPTGQAIGQNLTADWSAEQIETELRAAGLDVADGWPVFDLMFVGIGADGHLLSVFPGSAAFDSPKWALGIPAPTHIEPHVARVTLNPATVRVAHRVLAVVLGAAKADLVGRLFREPTDLARLPAQLAIRDGATWILDEAAAAQLPS